MGAQDVKEVISGQPLPLRRSSDLVSALNSNKMMAVLYRNCKVRIDPDRSPHYGMYILSNKYCKHLSGSMFAHVDTTL